MPIQSIMKTRIIAIAVAAVATTGCFARRADVNAPELRVRRGPFVRGMLLTGELDAPRGAIIVVPPLPQWNTTVKWLAPDGADVKAGERIVELDNTQFTTEIDSKRQAVAQAQQELQQKEAEWHADLLQKQLDLDKRRSELDKAELDAAVPREILPSREYETRQMKLRRAIVQSVKAGDVLQSQRKGVAADRANLLLKLDRAQRELAKAGDAIRALILTTPREGIVVVRDLPWENRKVQAGDGVFVGLPLVLIPDLSSLQVTAFLSDVDDGRITPGMPAVVTLDAYPSVRLGARIDRISAVAQEVNRNSLRRLFRVAVKLDHLDYATMRPGLSARVEVRADSRRDALLAPRAALDLLGDPPHARLGDGRRVPIRIGPCNTRDCVVLGGLKEGDRLTTGAGG